MTKKSDEPSTTVRITVSKRNMANTKARACKMTTLAWLGSLIEKEPSGMESDREHA